DAEEDRQAPADDLERALDDPLSLVVIERRALPGGADRKDSGDARVEIVAQQSLVAGEVDGAVHERGDDGQPHAADRCHGGRSSSAPAGNKRPATGWSRAS